MRAFRETLEQDAERAAVVSGLSVDAKLGLYAGLLRARLHDIQLKRWVRTGVLSKAWLATGEEATTVGPVHALERGRDIVAPMIRNAAACCELGLPVADMLRAYLGSDDSPSHGRDLHVGAWAQGVLQPISHVGDMVPVITGIGLTFKMREEPRVALTWVGDGSTKTAAAHEGTNFAAVQKLPVIFIVQNNQVALGTRLEQHHLAHDFRDWAASYGILGATFDGNNDEREARETFPDEWFRSWGQRDPIGLYEEHLKEDGVSVRRLEEIESGVTAEVDRAAEEAVRSRDRLPAGESALAGVYAKGG